MYSKDPVIMPKNVNRSCSYLATFAFSYIASGGHDASPLEIQAEKGSNVFRNFYKFVNHTYGKNSLENLLKSSNPDEYKINTINQWWKDYESKSK